MELNVPATNKHNGVSSAFVTLHEITIDKTIPTYPNNTPNRHTMPISLPNCNASGAVRQQFVGEESAESLTINFVLRKFCTYNVENLSWFN